MSKNGDVVWANGLSWQRDTNYFENEKKQWWYSSVCGPYATKTLKELKTHSDFCWLVKNGQVVTQYVLNPDDYVIAEKPVMSETLKKEIIDDTAKGMYCEREAIVAWLRERGQEQHGLAESLTAVANWFELDWAECGGHLDNNLDDNDDTQTAEPAFLFYGFPEEESFGRHKERAAIIAWMRKSGPSGLTNMRIRKVDDAIEQGEHLQDNDISFSEKDWTTTQELNTEWEQKQMARKPQGEYPYGYDYGVQVGKQIGKQSAQTDVLLERAAIVAWMRERAEQVAEDSCAYNKKQTVEWKLADEIERSEHLQGQS